MYIVQHVLCYCLLFTNKHKVTLNENSVSCPLPTSCLSIHTELLQLFLCYQVEGFLQSYSVLVVAAKPRAGPWMDQPCGKLATNGKLTQVIFRMSSLESVLKCIHSAVVSLMVNNNPEFSKHLGNCTLSWSGRGLTLKDSALLVRPYRCMSHFLR